MKLPIINSITTFLDNAGQLAAGRLDAAGRFLVNVSNSIAPTTGPTPPPLPNDGDQWFNTSPNFNILFSYSAALGFWVSAEFMIPWGEDSLDGGRAGWAGIGNAGVGTAMLVPRDTLLTALTATIRAGNNTKQFFLTVNGATVQTINLAGGTFTGFPNLQVDAGQEFWIQGNGAGISALDITFSSWWRWRVAP